MANRADLSQFLIHLTKNGAFQEWLPSRKGGYYFRSQTVQAKSSLVDILNTKQISARSPFGYFKLKIDYPTQVRGGMNPDWIKAVCFSEAPLREINSFYAATIAKRNHYQKYGLAFWQEKMRLKGTNPIFYVDSRRADFLAALDIWMAQAQNTSQPILHLIETFGPLVLDPKNRSDFRWEREWRKRDHLIFSEDDVAFGICPDSEINTFEGIAQKNGLKIVFIDPDWNEVRLKNYLTQKAPALLPHF